MDHYVDIEVRPDPEFPASHLMSALFSKLHRALVSMSTTSIGVSFPGFDLNPPNLGNCLRLHGELLVLSELLKDDWLSGMRDHVRVADPALVPKNAQHREVRRLQVKSSPERLRRRLMSRHNFDTEEARHRIPDMSARFLQLPFVNLRSTSTGQSYRVFFDQGPLQSTSVPGAFNSYGLSQSATVPWF